MAGATFGPVKIRARTELRHVDWIRSKKVLTVDNVYGQGELFFVRKVRDPEVVDHLEQFLQTQPDSKHVSFEH